MTAVQIIQAHIPSLTDANDLELDGLRFNSDVDRFGQPAVDNADLAIRTCACGERIDGYHEYVAHLIAMLEKG